MRLDKYLKVSRLIKRRTVANEVADAGRILINGKTAKASQAVKGNVMKQQDAKPEQALPHDLILEGRNKLTVTGVRRVIRCDAEGAALLTSKGTLELTGAELSVTSLDLDKGEVKLTGRVDTLEYTAEHTPGGFLRRLVR